MGIVICFTSGKGGVGKSSAAVGLAVAFAARNKRTIVAELDIGLRGIDLFFGISEHITRDMGDVFAGRHRLQDVVMKIEPFACLHYLPASARVPDNFDFSKIENLVQELRTQYDVVLLDTGAGLGLSIVTCVQASDLAVIVSTADPVCMRAGAKVTMLLEEYSFCRYKMLINKVSAKMLRHSTVQNLDEVMDAVGAPLLGIVPEDERYQKDSANGILPAQDSRIAKAYNAISKRIEGEYVPLTITRLRR